MPLKVIIPVNRLERAKGRLSDVLSAGERRELALITLETVVVSASEAGLQPVILTADKGIATAFHGVEVLPEQAGLSGLNSQLEAAITRESDVLIVHGDLPLVTGSALARFVAAATVAPSIALVRSRDGGTNALLLRPPGRFELRYGRASFAAHDIAARAAGMAVVRHRDATLALDLDTPDDLLLLLTMDALDRSAAARYLRPMDLPNRIAALRVRGTTGADRP